jgi:hypothetical protein
MILVSVDLGGGRSIFADLGIDRLTRRSRGRQNFTDPTSTTGFDLRGIIDIVPSSASAGHAHNLVSHSHFSCSSIQIPHWACAHNSILTSCPHQTPPPLRLGVWGSCGGTPGGGNRLSRRGTRTGNPARTKVLSNSRHQKPPATFIMSLTQNAALSIISTHKSPIASKKIPIKTLACPLPHSETYNLL